MLGGWFSPEVNYTVQDNFINQITHLLFIDLESCSWGCGENEESHPSQLCPGTPIKSDTGTFQGNYQNHIEHLQVICDVIVGPGKRNFNAVSHNAMLIPLHGGWSAWCELDVAKYFHHQQEGRHLTGQFVQCSYFQEEKLSVLECFDSFWKGALQTIQMDAL